MNEVLVKIHAEKRFKTGTGNSREFRSNKLIPGIIYGEKKRTYSNLFKRKGA